MSIDTVSLIKVFSAYVCSFKLYCLFNTMKDAKIANNIFERLTKWIDRERSCCKFYRSQEQKIPHFRY